MTEHEQALGLIARRLEQIAHGDVNGPDGLELVTIALSERTEPSVAVALDEGLQEIAAALREGLHEIAAAVPRP